MSTVYNTKISFEENGVAFGDNLDFISLEDIIENCLTAKVKKRKLVVFHIRWEGSRYFDDIYESFTISEDKVDRIKEIIIGKKVDFGEIEGKHSQVYGTIESGDITIDSAVENVVGFITSAPSEHIYNHSFIEKLEIDLCKIL